MKKKLIWLLMILIGGNIFIYSIIYNYLYVHQERVNFLSVGQGDAELIQTKAGNILIDAGPDDSVVSQMDKCLPFYDRTIDVFVLSHPNKDHYAGLFFILDRYKVRAVVLNNLVFPSKLYQGLLQELRKRNIILIQGIAGLTIKGEKQSSFLQILYPFAMGRVYDNVNRLSSIDLWQTSHQSFLFTGDADFSEEKRIIPFLVSFPFASQRILKVAHHGSRYASSKMFLKAFSPQFAIIEVGKNHYGHPSSETLQRLNNISAKVYRTDRDGLIRISSY